MFRYEIKPEKIKIMKTTRMTIHRALSELKLIDAKIEKQINEISPSAIFQKGKLIQGYLSQEDFATAAQSKYQSVNDLIVRKNSIKSAIVKANGATIVKLGEQEMTIADAINFKVVVIFKKQLAARIKALHFSAVAELNRTNDVVEQNVQKLLEFTFGKENVKADPKDLEAVRKPYMEANEFHLLDPLKVIDKAESIEKEVSEFEAEIDAVLSEINAVTFIEIQ